MYLSNKECKYVVSTGIYPSCFQALNAYVCSTKLFNVGNSIKIQLCDKYDIHNIKYSLSKEANYYIM